MRKPILAILALSCLPAVALADVTIEEETKMGGIMKIMTLGKGMKSTTRVSGNFMRTDQGNEATIVDLDSEKILTLDTKKKTYSVMTFAEMRQKMEQAMAAVSGKAPEQQQQQEQQGQQGPEGKPSDVKTSADVRVSETGRTETIQGLECKQYLMELDVTFSSEEQQQSGTMTTVTEMWLAKDVPGQEELNAFYRKMAEKMGTTSLARQWMSGSQGEGPSQQFGADMQKMADEMKKMDGHSMRTVMYLGSPEAAKQEAMGQKPEGGGGFGGLGGMLKKMKPIGNEEPAQQEEGQREGGVMMKMTTETKKIETKPIDPKLFTVPSDYKLIAAE